MTLCSQENRDKVVEVFRNSFIDQTGINATHFYPVHPNKNSRFIVGYIEDGFFCEATYRWDDFYFTEEL